MHNWMPKEAAMAKMKLDSASEDLAVAWRRVSAAPQAERLGLRAVIDKAAALVEKAREELA